jgi:hypothetical protein
VAAGGLGARRPRCTDDRVLALAHAALRRGDYWGGVLPHSGRPGRAYAELSRLGAEFHAAGPLELPDNAMATHWIEGLTVVDATVTGLISEYHHAA